MAQAWLWWVSVIGFKFLSVPLCLWPGVTASNRCSVLLQLDTVPLQTHTHILDTVWGPWSCKEATWGPKSSVVVGWLYNLIAWIVSFFFFVVKFFFFCFFLASSCATYSCQTSTSPDITARLLGNNVIGWWTTCEHKTLTLNINEHKQHTPATKYAIYQMMEKTWLNVNINN